MPCTRGVHDYVCVRLRLCTTPCVRLDLQGVMCTMCHLSVCLAGCLSVWLSGCLSGCLAVWLSGCQVASL